MTGNDLLPQTVLQSKAAVYVRQSTQTQTEAHAEGRRRQSNWSTSPDGAASEPSK